jgi:asparagine N-glycosylation enzyme membrane subunit Stt3
MNKIARINSVDLICMEELEFVPDPTPVEKQTTVAEYSIIDLFKYKSLRYVSVACTVFNLIIEFIYDGSILSLDKIGINVYLNQILVGLVEMVAAIICSWLVVKVQRKRFLRICLLLAIILTLVIGVLSLFFEH